MDGATPTAATVIWTAVVTLSAACLIGAEVVGRWIGAQSQPHSPSPSQPQPQPQPPSQPPISGSGCTTEIPNRLRRLTLAASAAGLVAGMALAWLEASALGDDAGGSTWDALATLLAGTYFGHATLVGTGGWAALLACSVVATRKAAASMGLHRLAVGLALSLVVCSRSAVAHAASSAGGLLAWGVVLDVVHQLCTLWWTGEVIVGAWCVLGWRRALPLASPSIGMQPRAAASIGIQPRSAASISMQPRAAATVGEQPRAAAYAGALSVRATWALVGVVLTGGYTTWRSVGTLALPVTLASDAYVRALQWKLLAVGAAVLLGACNRWLVLPRLASHVSTQRAAAARWFVAVLRLESLVLCAVVVLAAVLANSPPPMKQGQGAARVPRGVERHRTAAARITGPLPSLDSPMPLMRIDAVEGRTPEQVQAVLDSVHRAMLTAFKVPPRDRYQVYQEHKPAHFVVQDTGLGIERTRDVLIVSVVSRPRSAEAKQTFYRELCHELHESCGIAASDVMVSIVNNTDDDWSFGNGVAQFLTGEL